MVLILRREQHEVLARIPEESFVEEVVRRLRSEPAGPDEVPTKMLDGWVRGCLARAHGHGITHQRHAWQFVKLSWTLGSGFASEPWAQEILALDLGGGTKINALWHELRRNEPAAEGTADAGGDA